MKILKVLYTAGKTGFFFDDQSAIKAGAEQDGFIYRGEAVTEGFSSVRQAGESISVVLLLEDGQIAVGDCAAVQYSGAGGRDPLFLAEKYIPVLQQQITPVLEGMDLKKFRETCEKIDAFCIGNKRLHTALRYGLSQAVLDGVAKATGRLKVEVICEEYGLPVIPEPVSVFAQSGDERYINVDKMILKEADVLPHGLINTMEEKLGRDGGKLLSYIEWLSRRITLLRRTTGYRPALHIDVYGTIGMIFDNNPDKIVSYLATLVKPAGEFPLYIEGPVDMGEKARQIEVLFRIKQQLEAKGIAVHIVADEWCNTLEDVKDFADSGCCHMAQIKTPDLGSIHNVVEAIRYCREKGMEAYQGGTCNETDISARICVHTALAARAERMLAKPGMGFDEGFSIVKNEMERTIQLMRIKGRLG